MTFGFAVLVNLLHLPPFFGILFGLGAAAILIDFRLKFGKLKKKANKIVNVIKTIDMATIPFFIGILLAVNALGFVGILDQMATIIFGADPASNPYALIFGHSFLGVISAIFDNVPLTAAVIDMLPDGIHYQYWVLLAITAGTGGSILIIGSAAGVAAMGQVPDLSIQYYIKKGSLPAFLGYAAAIGIWYLQMILLGFL
jgi:Na+/H+ antiporter NhaD/arsenite permease-like protein